jgi:hypothetical protein
MKLPRLTFGRCWIAGSLGLIGFVVLIRVAQLLARWAFE